MTSPLNTPNTTATSFPSFPATTHPATTHVVRSSDTGIHTERDRDETSPPSAPAITPLATEQNSANLNTTDDYEAESDGRPEREIEVGMLRIDLEEANDVGGILRLHPLVLTRLLAHS